MEDFSKLTGGLDRQEKEDINRDGFRKDHEDGFFCSSSLNLLHDSNSSICNE